MVGNDSAYPSHYKYVYSNGSSEVIRNDGLTKFEHLVIEFTKTAMQQHPHLDNVQITSMAIAQANAVIDGITKYNKALKEK